MMKTKLTTIAVLMLLFCSGLRLSAQDGLGLNVGYVTSVNIKNYFGEKGHSPVMNGLRVGATQDIKLAGQFYFEPGLYYSFLTDKGDIASNQYANYFIVDLLKEHYLSIPLMFKYNFELSDAITGLYVFGGPTLIAGLSSKSTIAIARQTQSSYDFLGGLEYNYYKNEITENEFVDVIGKTIAETYLPPAAYRRFDVALGIGVGLEVLEYLDVKVGYDWGLVNRVTGELSSDFKTRRSQFYITAGVRF